MNYGRVILGGFIGGIVFNAISIAINAGVLAGRYQILQQLEVLRREPRLPFTPIYVLLLILISIGLVWLYAAARPRLGPGPRTALRVGLTVGLVAGLPHALSQYAWTYVGGFVSLWWAIETVAGCALATLAGAWFYKE